ncbi:hypothetical protein [Luteimonas qiangzhengi]|uniref:hypothetical protein n=1 Tax=Luteimonas sp. MJ146 TaxID=3129240 RepID=UPI0031BA5F00
MAVEICKACGEPIEEGYATCWKCGTGVDGSPPAAEFVPDAGPPKDMLRILDCLRCSMQLEFVRRMKFHEGSLRPGVLLDAGRLLTNRESFDIYACPACGKVEFYLAGP